MKKEIEKKWYWAYYSWLCALCGERTTFRERTYNFKEKGWHDEGYEVCGDCERREFL